jgi:hypothetical protein
MLPDWSNYMNQRVQQSWGQNSGSYNMLIAAVFKETQRKLNPGESELNE